MLCFCVQLEGLTGCRVDRVFVNRGKSQGRRHRVCINDSSTVLLYFTHTVGSCCSMLFTSLCTLTATAGVTHWTNYLHISEQLTSHPGAFLILVGDFNHAEYTNVLIFHGNDSLYIVYTNQKGSVQGPLPHPSTSDHITVMLKPAYRTLVKVTKPIRKQVRVWPEGSTEALKDFIFNLRRLEYV